jgi:hypothetical protein
VVPLSRTYDFFFAVKALQLNQVGSSVKSTQIRFLWHAYYVDGLRLRVAYGWVANRVPR